MNAVSPVALEARAEYEDDENTLASHQAGKVIYDVFLGARSLWMRAAFSNGATIHFRLADAREGLTLVSIDAQKFGGRVELVSSSARFRVHYTIPRALHDVLHFTTWISPSIPLRNPFFPRDLYPVGDGVVHTTQRGPRTGIVYGSLEGPRGATFCYLQNLTALNDYSEATKTTPAGRVGGEWAELGYAPAVSDEHALGADKEFILSDAFIALDARVPKTDGDVARLYLELLATLYCELPKPTPQFRDWPTKSEQTVRDLSFSPQCTYQRDGARFLMPYVGDQEKPPESMVQFTVLMPLIEYEEWTGLELTLTMRLLQNFEKFFNHELGTIVRWLPGEKFGDTGEAGQSHENMDSWYLYHILFNLSRLAALGNAKAREMFRKSLPFAIRVAQRFDYRFPVFFHMETLEIVRAESAPGKGGERDVPGLYA